MNPALLALGIASVLVTAATESMADDVDRYIESQRRALHLPGVSVAVVKSGEVVKSAGYGLADIELGAAATPATVYEIGSMTKQFTAAAILLLAEQGRLRLEDSITRYLPDAPATWKQITLRQLLTHTSGIQNHVAIPDFMRRFSTNLRLETSPSGPELWRLFYSLPLEFEPGQTWAYDNTGYHLLGTVIEKVSGRSYWEFLSERIFGPLGMTRTRSTDMRSIVEKRAAGYEWTGTGYENRPVLPSEVGFAAGAMISTVGDLAKWDAALRSGSFLSSRSREQMWSAAGVSTGQPHINYGLGWFLGTFRGRRVVQHGGGTPGFSSVIYRFDDAAVTVIVLCNRSDRILDTLALDIAGLVEPRLRLRRAAVDPHPRETAQARDNLTTLMAGREVAHCSVPFRLFSRTASGRSFWEWLLSHGELKRLDYAETDATAVGRLVRYQAILGADPYWLSIVYGPSGEILQVFSG